MDGEKKCKRVEAKLRTQRNAPCPEGRPERSCVPTAEDVDYDAASEAWVPNPEGGSFLRLFSSTLAVAWQFEGTGLEFVVWLEYTEP